MEVKPLVDLVSPMFTDVPIKYEISEQTNEQETAQQEKYILPHRQSEVNDHTKEYLHIKQLKDEEVSCEGLESKYTLNLIPVVKLERNHQIEDAVNKTKREKENIFLMDVKLKDDPQTVPFMKIKKELTKGSNTEQLWENHKLDEYSDVQNIYGMNHKSMDSKSEIENSLPLGQETSDLTFFVCPKCNQFCRNRSLLVNHMCSEVINDTNNKYKYSRDDRLTTFSIEETLRRYDCISDDCTKREFECSKCHGSYRSKKSLRLHPCKGDIRDNKMFKCVLCQKIVKGTFKFLNHIEAHKTEKPFSCSECGRRFRKKTTLILHTRRHTDSYSFRCKKCGKGFPQQAHLMNHMLKYTKERPYKCDQCNKAFKSRRTLKVHMRVHADVKPVKCQECGKDFVDYVALNKHKKIHSQVKPHKCDICDKCFHKADHLKTHVRIHTGEKPYVCTDCGKRFSQNSALTIHKRVHNRAKPYECEECGDRFKHSSTLLVHSRSHSSVKPYKCEECGKCFSQNSNCHTHMRSVHKRKKINECDVCGKSFALKSYLLLHIKCWHDDNLFTCGVCKKSVKSKYHFHNHVQIHISNEEVF